MEQLMAKKITGYIKLQVPAGAANPSPPIGPALGQRGLNIMEFCKAFNARTAQLEKGAPIPVVITAYQDRSFTFEMRQPPVTFFLKKAANLKLGKKPASGAKTAGRGFVGHEVLRRSGVGSLVVLPLSVAGERLGLIVVADRANRQPVNEDVELLELLALQAASGLRMASMISRLRERVTRDPLTGLRASLPPLPDQTGVVLVDVDRLADVNDVGGQAAGDDVLRATAGLLRELMPPGSQAFRIGSDEFVLMLDPRRASAAEHVGWELRSQAPLRIGRTVSVGVAVGAAGESGEAVVLRAGVALDEVKRAGADGVSVA